MGRNQLPGGQWNNDSADWLDFRPLWAETVLPVFGQYFRPGLGLLRVGPNLGPDCAVSPAAGVRGGGNAALFASHHDGNLSARRAADGDGDLVDGDFGGTGLRTDDRRLDHRQLVVAVDLLHQCANRPNRHRDGKPISARSSLSKAAQPAYRLFWHHAAHPDPGPDSTGGRPWAAR